VPVLPNDGKQIVDLLDVAGTHGAKSEVRISKLEGNQTSKNPANPHSRAVGFRHSDIQREMSSCISTLYPARCRT
jgi:hypothetical protein